MIKQTLYAMVMCVLSFSAAAEDTAKPYFLGIDYRLYDDGRLLVTGVGELSPLKKTKADPSPGIEVGDVIVCLGHYTNVHEAGGVKPALQNICKQTNGAIAMVVLRENTIFCTIKWAGTTPTRTINIAGKPEISYTDTRPSSLTNKHPAWEIYGPEWHAAGSSTLAITKYVEGKYSAPKDSQVRLMLIASMMDAIDRKDLPKDAQTAHHNFTHYGFRMANLMDQIITRKSMSSKERRELRAELERMQGGLQAENDAFSKIVGAACQRETGEPLGF